MGFFLFFCIRPPPGLLPVLGQLERYMTPTLDSALLISSWVGADLGKTSDRLESLTANIDACIINPRRDPTFYNLNCDTEFPLLND